MAIIRMSDEQHKKINESLTQKIKPKFLVTGDVARAIKAGLKRQAEKTEIKKDS